MRKTFLSIFLLLFSLALFSQSENSGHFQFLTGYYNDIVYKPSSRNFHFFHSGLGYKGNLTAIYGKVNLGYKYNTVDGVVDRNEHNVQLELDYWQSLSESKSTSFWLNYAYGLDDIFPDHRVIFEVWQKLFAGFLVSGGLTHHQFTESHATFVNAGLENYFGRWWVEGKTYLYLKKPNVTATYALTGRMFIKDVNFLEVGVSAGSAQDEPFLIESDLDRRFAYSGKVRYVTNIFAERMRVSGTFAYMYEEYRPDTWRNRYSFGVGLIVNLNK